MDRTGRTTLRFAHNEQEIALEAEPLPDGWRVRLPSGSVHTIRVRRLPENWVYVTQAEQTLRIPFALNENDTFLAYQGHSYRFTPILRRQAASQAQITSGLLSTPMAGVVVEVMAEEGVQVMAGQPLAVIEAMKVMTTLEAPFAGRVRKVYVQKAERVEHGAPIVEIVADASS